MSATTPEQLSSTFAAAINAHDVPGALALWAEDAAIVTAEGELLSGHAQIAPALEALAGNGTTVAIEISRLYVAGDVAVATGSLTMTSAGEHPFEASSSSTVVYRRGEDRLWRIALDAPWGLPAS
jgi:uncharacterized protein (TIGR02246 family)